MTGTTPLDSLLFAADSALRAVFAPARASREPPDLPPEAEMTETERAHAGGLMRVNHSGEVAAQALYHSQAWLARTPEIREFMLRAAREEGDHLAWCESRLKELNAGTSRLNPLWYAGSFAIGAVAAVLGDQLSLGFVTETERQVEGHLAEHLQRLPIDDGRSRRIVKVMQLEEAGHAKAAQQAGAITLPQPVRALMKLTSKLMTRTAYWL
jgi:3-demethoxyubiquinol 3-hydroxylase